MSNHTARPDAAASGYAGDVDAAEAWKILNQDPAATLIDVRSAAEWQFVGVPDLSPLGKEAVLAELQIFPGMVPNARFVEQVRDALKTRNIARDAPLLFICRSGARSRNAAIVMTDAGYTRCYNVAGGFEGDLDAERHRGRRNGWKAAGLPWSQS